MTTKQHQHQDELSALLASTGGAAVAVQQSSYEAQVLLNATLRDAPQLPLYNCLSVDSSWSTTDGLTSRTSKDIVKYCGLPDLVSLCGICTDDSKDKRSGKNHKKRKMSQNQNSLGNVQNNPECMTLFKVLTKTRSQLSRFSHDGVDASLSHPFGESKDELKLNMKIQIILSYFEIILGISNPDEYFEATLAVNDEYRRAYTCVQRGSMDPIKSSTNKKQKKVVDPSHILERIKNGLESIRSDDTYSSHEPSFGKQALNDRRKNTKMNMTKRGTMMDFKRQLLDDADRIERPDANIMLLIEKRKKKREERCAMRKARRAEKFQEISRNAVDEEEEMAFEDDHNNNAINSNISFSDSKTECNQFFLEKVVCPLCNDAFSVEAEDIDNFLSSHMDRCQKRGGRVTRSSRKTHESDDFQISFQQPLLTKSASLLRKKRPSIVFEKLLSIDDMDDICYDERVEIWIESGIDSMKKMTEQLDEEPPGIDMYQGGLIIPSWINNRLFGYQRTALRWMWELHKQGAGGLVGDEMGLGKTVQVSSFLSAMTSSRMLDSVLIIAPATMLRHWLNELKIWAPGLRRILLHNSGETDGLSRKVSLHLLTALDRWLKKARKYRINEPIDVDDDADMDKFCGTGYVILTTYEQVRINVDLYTNHFWSYIVIDEGQKIRNPDAEVTLACKRFRTPHRLLLSGTPIQNDLRELWSLFDFVFPGRLGTLPAFELEFADPIKRGGYANASKMQVQLAYRCSLVLRDLINPFMLRRQKRDMKEIEKMPGKTEQVLFCRLTSRQRTMYEAYLHSDEVIRVLAGKAQCFRSITLLRKICNHPDLVCDPNETSFDKFVSESGMIDGDLNDSSSEEDFQSCYDPDEAIEKRSGKLEVLSKILPLWQTQGHRVLIFSQTRQMLNILQRFILSTGLKYLRLDGNTNVNSRQNLIDKFNNDESIFVMLLTTRTGGVGVNLTGANRIVVYDPDWNPQVDAQSRERAWRFGQKREIAVYRLITAGAIEEKIYHRQIFKTALSNQILQDPKQRRLFSQKDLKDLFTLKDDIGAVGRGGEGVTETGDKLGDGVIQPNEINYNDNTSSSKKVSSQDDLDTLKIVLSSKGLAGIWDHDFVGNSKLSTTNELENEAVRVANKAAESIRSSVSQQSSNIFQPTWTGSDITKPTGRFGSVRGSTKEVEEGTVSEPIKTASQFGSASIAGVTVPSTGGISSNNLLAKLKQRQSDAVNATTQESTLAMSDVSKYAKLQAQIREYLSTYTRQGGVQTKELLNHFSNIPDRDAAIFKRLLINVALKERGKWLLKV